MKIIIIGKHGQIASALQKVAHNNSFKVIAFARDELDIRQPLAIENKIKEIKPDVIINTAAYLILAECEDNPTKAFEMNTIAVYNLARLCKQYTIKFITYSTDYVFDGSKLKPYNETDRTNPLQIYGLSKMAGEIAACNYYHEGSYIIRTSGVFGGGSKGSTTKKGNFVLGILNDAVKKERIEVKSTAIMAPTYASDLAIGTLKLLTQNAKPSIYHLINEGYCSWQEFAEMTLMYSNSSKHLFKSNEPTKENFIRPQYTVLANTHAKKLGIVLPSLQEGLQRYIKEELKL